jgi:hypothetical protein
LSPLKGYICFGEGQRFPLLNLSQGQWPKITVYLQARETLWTQAAISEQLGPGWPEDIRLKRRGLLLEPLVISFLCRLLDNLSCLWVSCGACCAFFQKGKSLV